MKKNIILSFVILTLILGLGLTPIVNERIIVKSRENSILNLPSIGQFTGDLNNDNPWNPEDEGDHFPTGWEYWWNYMMLTLDDGSHWDIAVMFLYQMNWTGRQWSDTDGFAFIRIQSWNRETGKYYDCIHVEYHPGVLQHKKNIVDLKFYNSTMKGLYPNYSVHAEDDINNIELTVDLNALALPHWIAQDALNGELPVGTGSFHYGGIPFVGITGNLSINGTKSNVTGVGYYERAFGNAHLTDSYIRFTSFKELRKVRHLYSSIAKWLLKEIITNGIKKTHSLHRSTDNLLGYDWVWIAFENGWSMILCRLLVFGKVDGLSPSILMLNDGKEYWEFGDVYVKAKRNIYLEESDIFLPLDLEITGFKGNKQIHVVFNSTTNMTKMYINIGIPQGNFLVAGEATGFFKDGEKTITLNGNGTNTPLRVIPKIIKHRSLKIDILLPPNGLGISVRKVSHRLGFERFFKFQLRPFEFIFYIKPVSDI